PGPFRPCAPAAEPLTWTCGRCLAGAGPSAPRARRRLRSEAADQDPLPRDDVGLAAQQRSALPFGHSAPNALFNPFLEGLHQTLSAHRAARADGLGPILPGAVREQL